MHAAEIPFGGGVSPRFTRRLKGQSTIEYVLIIAIIVLVILIAGPLVSSAIRNQFNLVAGTLGSGTTGENFYEPEDIPDPENGTAFAIYSEDDHSLMFYKRRGVPKVGDMFNYRRVTEVYTGFEDASYEDDYDPKLDNWTTMTTNAPWFGVRDNVSTVKVVDSGISPRSLKLYFYGFKNLKTADLTLLDTSRLTSLYATFCCDYSVESIKLPGFFSALTDCEGTFAACSTLTALEIGPSDFSGVTTFFHMFLNAWELWFDCSSWNVNESALHRGLNQGAPGVILPKAWQ